MARSRRTGTQRHAGRRGAAAKKKVSADPDRRKDVQAQIVHCVQDLLGVGADQVDTQAPLMEMGLDSLAVTQLVRELSETTGTPLPPTLLFDFPTVDALTTHIVGLVEDDAEADLSGEMPFQSSLARPQDEEVAIVGMSCRFGGGVEGPAMTWDAVEQGKCMVNKVPFSRWDVDAQVAADPTLPDRAKKCMLFGGFMSELELFDAGTFNISPAEAMEMDPQQRVVLEYALLALVDAGFSKDSCPCV